MTIEDLPIHHSHQEFQSLISYKGSNSSKLSSNSSQDQEIEDDDTCKPLHITNIESSDIKAGRRIIDQ